MISVNNRDFLITPIADYIISSEKVAHVQIGNSAEHALLVLTKTGYSSIPVLNAHYQLLGLLSMQMITESILGLSHIEYERLPDLKVDDIMQTEIPTIKTTDRFQKGLDLLINHTFICVIEEDGTFAGILTRRVLLKQFKKYLYSVQQ
jgi:predicted transcriptional regulator